MKTANSPQVQDQSKVLEIAKASEIARKKTNPQSAIRNPQFLTLAVITAVAVSILVYQNYFARTNTPTHFIANVKPFSGATGRENSPAFSPDSKQIAFSWNGGTRENSDIYVQIVGAGDPVRLTDTEEIEHYPVFSPDGRRIVFRSSRSGNPEAWIADADGRNLRQITDSKWQVGNVRFSPDSA